MEITNSHSGSLVMDKQADDTALFPYIPTSVSAQIEDQAFELRRPDLLHGAVDLVKCACPKTGQSQIENVTGQHTCGHQRKVGVSVRNQAYAYGVMGIWMLYLYLYGRRSGELADDLWHCPLIEKRGKTVDRDDDISGSQTGMIRRAAGIDPSNIQRRRGILEPNAIEREVNAQPYLSARLGLCFPGTVRRSRKIRQHCEQARTIVQRAMARSRATITSARAAITSLRAEIPTTDDILIAIEAEAEHFTLATGIPCTCSLQTKLPGEYHEHLLRLVSEGLTNIARHARASQAWVRADGENAAITLEIGDNGIGFEPAKATTGHYGLLGLRERARLMNGQLLISSEPSKGTTIRLWLPWERGSEDEQRAG